MLKRLIIAGSIALISQAEAQSVNNTSPIGKQLLQTNCLGCHTPTDSGLSRISKQRKTPEGWEMTINRMRLMHGLHLTEGNLKLNNSALHELVKYLADIQGLAPQETTNHRYLMEQDLNRVENVDNEQVAVTCGRCHSSSRVALQRRPESEWSHLIDFHLGQFPSTEYSLFGRDRDWYNIAKEEIAPLLAKKYPLESKEWQQWQSVEKQPLQGKWVLSGHMPGKGYFTAKMNVSQNKADYYSLTVNGTYNNGEAFTGKGSSVVYTGYEWRGKINFGDISLHQTLAANADGSTLIGRFYQKDQEAIGADIHAIKDSTDTQLLSIYPSHIKKGETATLTITGTGLNGIPTFSNGITVEKVIKNNSNQIVLVASAQADTSTGYSTVSLGKSSLSNKLAVYNSVQSIAITPNYGLARVGGNGGSTSNLNVAFRALGVDFGEDGQPDTDDDINLGYISDVSWHVVPRDDIAEEDQDVKFAGSIDKDTGIFIPAPAGPNPERKRSTNNAGNLNVVATYAQHNQLLTAQARLLVTVQRWNNPPLK